MDNSEIEENLFALGEPKLHGGMCKILSSIYVKVLSVFPDLEAARPRSTSGIQALCSLHIALEKTKTVLQHCAECSKLYLAITGDSVVLKFEKARSALEDGLRRVEDIVPQTIGCQISEILHDLEGTEFSLDPLEKQVGDEIIGLLQQGRNFNNTTTDNNNELETFHQAATRLGITSSRAALRERRALKKLIEKARIEEDKRKESIVAYLVYLIRKYSKLFRSDFSDDNDSQGSTPCSPTGYGGGTHAFERQLSKLSSFNFKPNLRRSGRQVVVPPPPPEELRCPISLQLMYDPVIIASGQTYERVCIEKWFSDGHDTCPKTRQQLDHRGLTPNYCVKGLVASWCDHNGTAVPDGPPDSLDLNYWRLALSESESVESVDKGAKVAPLPPPPEEEEAAAEDGGNVFARYDDFLTVLESDENTRRKRGVVERIRCLLKDDEEARIYMGANGFVEALLRFLEASVSRRDEVSQETGAMALFNLAVNNNRNKETMLAAGVLAVLGQMTAAAVVAAATALYLNLSCLEQAKPVIGATDAVPFLVDVLRGPLSAPLCRLDALHAVYHLSTWPANVPRLVAAGIVGGLEPLLVGSGPDGPEWTEKAIAVLTNLTGLDAGADAIVAARGVVGGLSTVLDGGEPEVQEAAAACLLVLCTGSEKCSEMVLQEGVIPSLVSISVNGTMRGRQKAQKLLMLFREQRQRDPVVAVGGDEVVAADDGEERRSLSKTTSKKKMGRAWSFWRRNKSFSVYQC